MQFSEEFILQKIYFVRGIKVMLDRDLAELYGVETKRLKEAVRRNKSRFPDDFMFEMTDEELHQWRTHFATSKSDRTGLRHRPFCFTEHGVTMISCILNSPRAIAVNIQIIRIFSKMREMIISHKDILLQLHKLENAVEKNTADIENIFSAIRQLIQPQEEIRTKIGFKRDYE